MTLDALVRSAGYIGLAGIVFAENGLLIGFFLPGDSLLFTAGFLASQGFFDPWGLLALLIGASILGTQVGYMFGQRWGRRLFQRPNSRFFKQENLQQAENFYERHGGKTIILARFIPIIRTFAPIVAGVGRMSYGKFLIFNFVGGVLWVGSVLGLGIWLGDTVPNVDRYILPIIGVIIVLSVLPGMIHMLKTPAQRQSTWAMIRHIFGRP